MGLGCACCGLGFKLVAFVAGNLLVRRVIALLLYFCCAGVCGFVLNVDWNVG